MKKLNGILWGAALIALGVIWALNSTKVIDINLFFDGWWTLFMIVPCAIGLITDRDKFGNLAGLCLGIILLLCCQGIFKFSYIWKLFIPIVIVIAGIKIIVSNHDGYSRRDDFSKYVMFEPSGLLKPIKIKYRA